jgi:hypothetical protein
VQKAGGDELQNTYLVISGINYKKEWLSSCAGPSRKFENRFCEVAIASHVCDFKKAKTKITINQSSRTSCETR